ncbi:MAG: DinB family protein [Spirosomataceae bacterium]|jgi:hypothetical protein
MIETARHLKEIINKANPLLIAIKEKDAAFKPKSDKWSKKEIIGHLIDSASNNHQKFVRLMQAENLAFIKYDQELWVANQRYNKTNWLELINFWSLYNSHLAHIIEFTVAEKLQNKITINDIGPFTLEFIMKDYVEHLKHHLKAILPDSGIDSKFENIYNQ